MSDMKIILLLILLISASYIKAQIVWHKVSTLPDNPRAGVANFIIDSNFYILGGLDSLGQFHKDIWEFNLNTSSWLRLQDCFYGKVCGTSGASIGNHAIIANEIDSVFAPIKETWKYNVSNDTWMQLPPLAVTTEFSPAFSYGREFYLCFGLDSFNGFLNTVWAYDTFSSIWNSKTALPGKGRDYCNFAQIDSFVYFAGGRDSSYNSINEFWRYNIASDAWLRLPDIPGMSRFGALVYAFQNFIIVGNGFHNQNTQYYNFPLSDLYKFDITSNQWSTISYSGRDTPIATDYSCFQFNKKCFVYGGYRKTGSYYNDLWMFDPAPLGPVWDTLSTGVQEVARDIQGLRLYPIPVRDILHIDGDIQGLDISVTDMMGRRCAAPVSGRDIAVSSLPAGVYVLHVSDRGAMVVRRFLKE